MMEKLIDSNRRGFLKRAVLVGGLSVAGVSGAASAAGVKTHHVHPDNDPPFDTISGAVAAASNGDTILVAGGHTYPERVHVRPSKGLTILGEPGGTRGAADDAPVLDGAGEAGVGFFLEGGDVSNPQTTIDGFEIRHYGDDVNDNPGHGILADSRSNVSISNVSIHDIAGRGVALFHRGLPSVENWEVRDSEFRACADWAISLLNVDGLTIANNHVKETTIEVSDTDRDDAWWEQDTVDGNPQGGIKIEGGARDGRSGRTSDVLLEDNRIDGSYDDTALRLFSYHFEEDEERDDTTAVLREVTVRNNVIDIGDGFDNEGSDENGVLLAANASSHGEQGHTGAGAERPISPAEISAVTIEGNSVTGAGAGYQVFSMAPDSHGGTRDVDLLDNEAINCETGTLVASFADGGVRDVTVDGLETRECDIAVTIGGLGDDVLEDVELTNVEDTEPGTRTSKPGKDFPVHERLRGTGIMVIGRASGGIDGVTISGYTPPDRPVGVWVEAPAPNAVSDVDVTDCTFDEVDEGIVFNRRLGEQESQGAVGDGFNEISITECNFLDLSTGIRTSVPDDVTADLGDSIRVHRSDFSGNSEFAIDNHEGGGVIDASCNYWGSATGPTHAANRPGQGDPVMTSGVDYRPWIPRSFEDVPEEACHVGQHEGTGH